MRQKRDWEYGLEGGGYGELMKRRALGKEPEMEQTKQLVKLVRGVYQPGMKFLDVCCGVGHFYTALKKIDKDIIYRGVDASQHYINLAKSVFAGEGNVTFTKGDIFDLKVGDDEYDIVICYTTLQHFPDYKDPVRELARVASKHIFMRLLLSDHTYIIKRFKPGLKTDKGEPAFVYYNIWCEDEFVRYLKSLGVRQVKVHDDEFNIKLEKKDSWSTYTYGDLQISGNLIMSWKHVHAAK